ncbi:MAG: NAD-binding protein, partial [Paucibacter sp.]|nr:NAD-binding protein [Roseateles sp.]
MPASTHLPKGLSPTLHDAEPQPQAVDVAIVGGGPAACSAASWLSHLGLQVALIERAPELCHGLRKLHFQQDWVLGAGQTSLAQLGERYADEVQA